MGEYTKMNFDLQCIDMALTLSNPLKPYNSSIFRPASAQDRDKWQAVMSTLLNF